MIVPYFALPTEEFANEYYSLFLAGDLPNLLYGDVILRLPFDVFDLIDYLLEALL